MRLAQGPIRAELADHSDRLFELQEDPDPARAAAVTKSLHGMRKIVIAESRAPHATPEHARADCLSR